jgi:hypothetical protein
MDAATKLSAFLRGAHQAALELGDESLVEIVEAAHHRMMELAVEKGEARQIGIQDILTDSEIQRAIEFSDHDKILSELIEPNMDRINQSVGQENDARYLAYAVQHILRAAGAWKE